ncbi:hypothetical protein BUALT_Bualt04G0077400 [Buddleja alternifolia]|uniref:Uncharacterized protein n=1 Tax=Buddleja alternifolia TaxID=168488 RepID=A0AAV6XVA8_9LAMI|nr:hypothetical protein BUALT_Bualt04G0077400 [Buddleja alternifolia]
MRSRVSDESGESGNGHESKMVFINEIMRSTYDLSMRCKTHGETRKMLFAIMDSAIEQTNGFFENLNLNDQNPSNAFYIDADNAQLNEVLIRNPTVVKSRGITNVVIQHHWDYKSKKGKAKGKTQSSRCDGGSRGVTSAEEA